ncbi:hypothetical protein G7Y89_g11727 [Cudoniella acicularis]|uniref:Uncharacterized protein n=1 Tax=Cudoniella acicularis TaxID=354080 RepID=A0A8H4RCL7_9HELO|nr:hypothetical protein G7Y89_g11727 [Cudoniella acicularis]
MSTADTARLSTSASAPIKSPPSMPTPSWQYTIRNILGGLSKTVLTDAQLSDLHITLEDEDERSMHLSIETSLVTDAFFDTSTYHGDIKCLPRDFQTRPEMAKACSEWIASLFTCWAQALGNQHSENRVTFQRAEKALRITGDTRTKGVKTAMTARDMENGHSISVLIRNRRRHEWQLTSVELYILFTLADEQRLARPSASSYEVQIMVIHRHWIQRLSVQIPSLFLTSIIGGEHDLLGNIHIHRTPRFNFMEEQGRRGALRALFEHFPLNTTCTLPPLPPIPTTKRKWNNTGFALKKQRTQQDQLCISATTSHDPKTFK